VTAFERDGSEAEALLTDLYLEGVLAGSGVGAAGSVRRPDARLDPAIRLVSDRLRHDLVRVHPSFRFEERLAARLAEAAAGLRMSAAAGGEATVVPIRLGRPVDPIGTTDAADVDRFARDAIDDADDRRELARPLLIGGALTSAAISLAGAAFVAWRRTRPVRAGGPMVRAARAVRHARLAAVHTARPD
jgi:hypothetical protein